jgi:hypothetical protein
MNTRLIVVLLCAGALAFACGPRTHVAEPASLANAEAVMPAGNTSSLKTSAAPSRRHAADQRGKNDEIKLDSRFHVDVAANEVRFALAVTNVAGKHVEVKFPSGQSYDFVVVDSVGREVWRWGTGRMFTQNMQDKQLGAGDAMQVSEAWKHPAAGRYTAIATLKSANYPVEQRVDFVVR